MIYTDKILTSNQLKILRWVDGNTFQKRLSYNLKNKKLISIRKWIYTFPWIIESFSDDEFLCIANKIYSPSYISFETVLQKEWIIFQYDNTIKIACKYHKSLHIESINLSCDFFKLPNEIFTEMQWIEHKNWYDIASKERAFCDTVFRSPGFYFDNLSWLDWDKVLEICEIYNLYKKNFLKNILEYKDQICENNNTNQ